MRPPLANAAWGGLLLLVSLPGASASFFEASSFFGAFSSKGEKQQEELQQEEQQHQHVGFGRSRARLERFLQPLGPPWTPAKVEQWLEAPTTTAPVGPHPYVIWVDQSVLSTTNPPLPEHCCGCTCVFAWPDKLLPAGTGGGFAKEYTCGGTALIPEIRWADTSTSNMGPVCFESYALIITDMDAPYGVGSGNNHIQNLFWAVNIPPTWKEFNPAQLATYEGKQVLMGRNSQGKAGMEPACPKQGKHRYTVALYALGSRIDSLSPTSSHEEVVAALEGNRRARVTFYAEAVGAR